MMITYTPHPQFEFDVLVDLYADGASSFQLSITKVERRLWGDECIAKIEGYVTVDVPIDACSARLVDKDEHLAEVAREAHKRNITSVKTHCVFSVMLDGRAYKAVKSYDQINMSRYFDVSVVGYVIDDRQHVDASHTVFDDEICSFATYYITELRNESYANRAYLEIKRKA